MRRHGAEGHHSRSPVNPTAPTKTHTVKVTAIAAAILVTLSVSGYFMGLNSNTSRISLGRSVETPNLEADQRASAPGTDFRIASRYIDVDRSKDGANSGWTNVLTSLKTASTSGPPANVTAAERQTAIADRMQRRAYDGAPPVVPHPITQDSVASCLSCHSHGLQIRDRMATRISHAHFTNCTQCHVPSQGAGIPLKETSLLQALTTNDFSGSTPRKGTRAWTGAPPTIPHPTTMRSDCASCHGSTGLYGLRTPHLDRQACTQCHVAEPETQQSPFPAPPPIVSASTP